MFSAGSRLLTEIAPGGLLEHALGNTTCGEKLRNRTEKMKRDSLIESFSLPVGDPKDGMSLQH